MNEKKNADEMDFAPSSKVVIALHCSGSSGSQWYRLGMALSPRYTVVAPNHYGCDSAGPWTGEQAFTLTDEAAKTIAIIDSLHDKVHIIGHSYGGAVALSVASKRLQRIASLTLYEPAAFHVLELMGERGTRALTEVNAIARRTADSVSCGDYRGAAAAFVDYWSDNGSWEMLRPDMQAALTRWAPKAPLDFFALLHERTPLNSYSNLNVPTLIMRGQYAPLPTRTVAEMLQTLLPKARLAIIQDAGHMGPLSHAAQVNEIISRHINEVDADAKQ